MTNQPTDFEHEHDETSRAQLAKGAAAAGALALGTAASSGSAAAQGEDEALIFAYDYHPGQDFEVLGQLQRRATIQILQLEGETVPELPAPTDYTGHVIRYDTGDGAGVTSLLFSEDVALSEGDTGTVNEDVSLFSPDLNLLSVTLE